MGGTRHTCAACGDPAMNRVKEHQKWYCDECRDEIVDGKIIDGNISMSGGTHAGPIDEDSGGYREIATRILEDGQ